MWFWDIGYMKEARTIPTDLAKVEPFFPEEIKTTSGE